MQASGDTEEPPLPLALSRFQVSEEFGFLLPDPLTELPAPYGPWMDIARELPQLIASHQLRSRVRQGSPSTTGALALAGSAPCSQGFPWQMPQLSCQHLRGREELHLAHLVLSFITMGYVWQEGEEGTVQVLPRNLAVPYWEVSQALGLPPILSHADFVLANWRRKDPNGPLEIENLDTIITLPGGESLQGFILVTLLVEKAAVPGIRAISQALGAVLQCDEDTLHRALEELAGAITAMREALRQMHDHVDPEVFYSEIRIFLSGWKDNPAMPHGLIYEGVSPQPLAYSGGSAAQSSVLHAFDELLGICHRHDSAAFLHRMRDYMPPPHRAFVEEIRGAVSLKQHVLSSGDARLRAAFNRCVSALTDFRSYHISIVTKYIATAAAKARARRAQPSASARPAVGKPPSALEDKGTGGSHIFSFLKSIRDTTREGMISA
ncbi:indoleamine 2,3-dioxygenase 2 isoform X2 [Parus major]|uniref:indoleamine 2,3-dioxygenase 2 isoform X2 n=1 Tax=Parus major TaxID=9157 RepID=UPI0007711EC4|nr:indoleamine 2,3-dioxygenase 2 isoform X2 [Parus major]